VGYPDWTWRRVTLIQFSWKQQQPRLEYIAISFNLVLTRIVFAFRDSDLVNAPFPPAPGLIKVGHAQCKLLKKLIAADKHDQFFCETG